jgi:hypothetical protein
MNRLLVSCGLAMLVLTGSMALKTAMGAAAYGPSFTPVPPPTGGGGFTPVPPPTGGGGFTPVPPPTGGGFTQ